MKKRINNLAVGHDMGQESNYSAQSVFIEEVIKRHRFVNVLLEIQETYAATSCEYALIKLAVAAITFCMKKHAEDAKQKLPERQRWKMNKIEDVLRQEYNDFGFPENHTESNSHMENISEKMGALEEWLSRYEKGTDIFDALQCSIMDIESALTQKNDFFVFLRSIEGKQGKTGDGHQ